MVVLDVDHPNIAEFIETKAHEERKIRALRDAGFDMDLDGKDIISVQYQNANNSVRVDDAFMHAVVDDRDWDLKAVTTGETVKTLRARDLTEQGDALAEMQKKLDQSLHAIQALTKRVSELEGKLAASQAGANGAGAAAPVAANPPAPESARLDTALLPDPDLVIRTSGEQRVSNFLLWQLSYTEMYVTPKLWPDFGKEDLIAAVEEFGRRQRRYGAV